MYLNKEFCIILLNLSLLYCKHVVAAVSSLAMVKSKREQLSLSDFN